MDGEISGFKYSFADCVIKGYSGQDHVQVAAVIQLAVEIVQDHHPAAKKIMIQSDNSSVFNMNTRLHNEEKLVLSRWVFTEAQTGKTRLDTHYSFLNKNYQAYVDDDNDILIEDDIMKSIIFNGGISGNTAVLVGAVALFGKRSLEKNNFKIKTGARETHEVCLWDDFVQVTKS